MSTTSRPAGLDLAELVHAAQSGDDVAWARLVERFDRMLRSIARSYRLSPQNVDDAVQATWVNLFEHIDTVRDGSAIAGWLATTVRRESLRVVALRGREQLSDDPQLGEARHDGPEAQLFERERRAVLARALAKLPDRQRRLMTLIASDAEPDYKQIGASLNMPVGSIGPIRARGLARLQRNRELREFASAG